MLAGEQNAVQKHNFMRSCISPCIILERSKSTLKSIKFLEKIPWDTQPSLGICESKNFPILRRERKRNPKSAILTELTVLFRKPLLNSFLHHFGTLRRES
jgi:hypothetical protein